MGKIQKRYFVNLLNRHNMVYIDDRSGMLVALLDDKKTMLIMTADLSKMTREEASIAYQNAIRLDCA